MNASRRFAQPNTRSQPVGAPHSSSRFASRLKSLWSWQRGLVVVAGTMAVMTSCSQGQLPATPVPATTAVTAQPGQPEVARTKPTQPTEADAPSQTPAQPIPETVEPAPAPVQPTPVQPVQPAPALGPTPLAPGGWRDTFDGSSLDTRRWTPSTGQWAAFWTANGLTGNFAADNLRLDGSGFLVMRLDLSRTAVGFQASAAELATTTKFGYGSYEVRMRAASTSPHPDRPGRAVSGNISAAFNYTDDSATEIDHEVEGQAPSLDWVGAWKGLSTHGYKRSEHGANLAEGFHVYRWDWQAGKLEFYLDGQLQHTMTSGVPSEAAAMMLNLWPTNSSNWGGVASEGTVYMLVDYAQFNPSQTEGQTEGQAQGQAAGQETSRPLSTGRVNPALVDW